MAGHAPARAGIEVDFDAAGPVHDLRRRDLGEQSLWTTAPHVAVFYSAVTHWYKAVTRRWRRCGEVGLTPARRGQSAANWRLVNTISDSQIPARIRGFPKKPRPVRLEKWSS